MKSSLESDIIPEEDKHQGDDSPTISIGKYQTNSLLDKKSRNVTF